MTNKRSSIRCRVDTRIVDEICKNFEEQYKSVKLGEEFIKTIIFSGLYNIHFSPEKQRAALQIDTQRII